MHPKDLDLTLEMSFSVSEDEVVTRGHVSEAARRSGTLLYVAWLTPAGHALKVGLSEKSLLARWSKVVRNMEQPLERLQSLRPNEIRDREKLLRESRGQQVELWMIPFPLPRESVLAQILGRTSLGAAEAFLDDKFVPKFGRPLGIRKFKEGLNPQLADPKTLVNGAKMHLTDITDHPKLRASSSFVVATCRAVCDALTAEGYRLSPESKRDGFVLEHFSRRSIRIDAKPKKETLRIKIGLFPHLQPPPELVHQGNQPDWIEVSPHQQAAAIDYLRSLVRGS